jgi:hypothetical protein
MHNKIRKGGSFTWTEREAIIKEYLKGEKSKIEIWKSHTGQNEEHGQILRWMRYLGYISDEKTVNRQPRIIKTPLKHITSLNTISEESSPEDLQKRIKELEYQLESANLKNEGYELMIDIAEKELKIPIRKKSDTK